MSFSPRKCGVSPAILLNPLLNTQSLSPVPSQPASSAQLTSVNLILTASWWDRNHAFTFNRWSNQHSERVKGWLSGKPGDKFSSRCTDTPLSNDKTNGPGVSTAWNSSREGPHTSPRFLSKKGQKPSMELWWQNSKPQWLGCRIFQKKKKKDSPVYQEMINFASLIQVKFCLSVPALAYL